MSETAWQNSYLNLVNLLEYDELMNLIFWWTGFDISEFGGTHFAWLFNSYPFKSLIYLNQVLLYLSERDLLSSAYKINVQ